MRTLSESERGEIMDALWHIDFGINSKNMATERTKLLTAVRPILDYAKAPQNFPDKFIEDQALNIARAINGN